MIDVELIEDIADIVDAGIYDRQLLWFPEIDIGAHCVAFEDQFLYDDAYFEKFAEYDETSMGRDINKFRKRFVSRHYDGHLVDVGIGTGMFASTREAPTWGYDVSDYGKRVAKQKKISWLNPYKQFPLAVSCWDSFEHIRQPWELVKRTKSWFFMTIPVFKDHQSVLVSHHYKPREHIWYFTEHGLIECFEAYGFELEDKSIREVTLGRAGVASYAFRRRRDHHKIIDTANDGHKAED